MDEEKVISKPLTVRKNDYIRSLVELTNNSGVPLFIIEYILKELLTEIHSVSAKQEQVELSAYAAQLDEEKQGD